MHIKYQTCRTAKAGCASHHCFRQPHDNILLDELLDSPLRSMARMGSLRNDSKKRCASITGLPVPTPLPLCSATAATTPSSRAGAPAFFASPSARTAAASASASAASERPKKRRLPPAAERWPGPSGDEDDGRLMMLHPPKGLRDLEGLKSEGIRFVVR